MGKIQRQQVESKKKKEKVKTNKRDISWYHVTAVEKLEHRAHIVKGAPDKGVELGFDELLLASNYMMRCYIGSFNRL